MTSSTASAAAPRQGSETIGEPAHTVSFRGDHYTVSPHQPLLDSLLNAGVTIPYSCRKGSCFTCLMTCVEGEVSLAACKGLRPTQIEQGAFLACQHRPQGDMTVALPEDPACRIEAVVAAKEILGPDVCLLRLEPAAPFAYRAGQFINLRRRDGLMRSYSLASLPAQDKTLEIHVKHLPGGALSGWLFESAEAGGTLEIEGPYGDCHYAATDPAQPLLLIGTGTGLSPLLGVLRDALERGHHGPIRLYHGSRWPSGLYRDLALQDLAEAFPNLSYHPCVSGGGAPDRYRPQRAELAAFEDQGDLEGWRVYLCGYPAMVEGAKRTAYLRGASLKEIHADPFDLRDLRSKPRADAGPPQPDTW